MAEKVVTMVLKVDLQCPRCYKKIKKVLCHFPQIRDQVYDEKENTVTITVACCSPEKIREKLCCKAGKIIKCIEIKDNESKADSKHNKGNENSSDRDTKPNDPPPSLVIALFPLPVVQPVYSPPARICCEPCYGGCCKWGPCTCHCYGSRKKVQVPTCDGNCGCGGGGCGGSSIVNCNCGCGGSGRCHRDGSCGCGCGGGGCGGSSTVNCNCGCGGSGRCHRDGSCGCGCGGRGCGSISIGKCNCGCGGSGGCLHDGSCGCGCGGGGNRGCHETQCHYFL